MQFLHSDLELRMGTGPVVPTSPFSSWRLHSCIPAAGWASWGTDGLRHSGMPQRLVWLDTSLWFYGMS